MIATVAREDLVRLMSRACAALPAKAMTPAQGAVLLRADAGRLTAEGVSATASCTTSEGAEVKASGSVAVAGKETLDRIKLLPAGPIKLVYEKDRFSVTGSGARRMVLLTFPLDGMLPIPAVPSEARFVTVPSATLRRALGHVEKMASPDHTKTNQHGVHVTIRDGRLVAETTDGHRAARSVVTVGDHVALGPEVDVIIGVPELRAVRSLAESSESIDVWANDTRIFLVAGNTSLTVARVQATFPPVDRIIPSDCNHRVRVSREGLRDALSAIGAHLRGDTVAYAALSFNTDGTIGIRGETVNAGDMSDSIPYDGPAFHAVHHVNPQYVVEALAVLEGEDVMLELSNLPLYPIVVVPPGDDRSHIHVVCPVRPGNKAAAALCTTPAFLRPRAASTASGRVLATRSAPPRSIARCGSSRAAEASWCLAARSVAGNSRCRTFGRGACRRRSRRCAPR